MLIGRATLIQFRVYICRSACASLRATGLYITAEERGGACLPSGYKPPHRLGIVLEFNQTFSRPRGKTRARRCTEA